MTIDERIWQIEQLLSELRQQGQDAAKVEITHEALCQIRDEAATQLDFVRDGIS